MFASINLLTNTISYQRLLPAFASPTGNTLAVIVSATKFYDTLTLKNSMNTNPTGAPNAKLLPAFDQSLIFSSDPAESCYSLFSDTPTVVNLTPLSSFTLDLSGSTMYSDLTTMTLTLNVYTNVMMKSLTTSALTSLDGWCTQANVLDRGIITPVVQA